MSKQKAPRVTTVGGGTGTPVINESLLLAGVDFIESIVTVMDSGGVTGRMRTDSKGTEIAYSDGLRTLLSLVHPKQKNSKNYKALVELLRKRNDQGQDLGYTIFSHFFDNSEAGFEKIQQRLEILTGINFCGKVIPVTLNSTNIVFRTKSGTIHKGEHELDDKRMSKDTIIDIWLEPRVKAYAKARTSIEKADFIIFCCGSLYGSLVCCLLPEGIRESLAKSRAKRIFVTNLVSTRVETHSFKPASFINIFRKYTLSPRPLSMLVVPSTSRWLFETKFPEVAKRYSLEHSHFLGWEKGELTNAGKRFDIEIVTHNATIIDPVFKRVRHDPTKLSETFKQILSPKT